MLRFYESDDIDFRLLKLRALVGKVDARRETETQYMTPIVKNKHISAFVHGCLEIIPGFLIIIFILSPRSG